MTVSGSTDSITEPKVLDEQGILLFNLLKLTEGRTEYGIQNTNFNKDPTSMPNINSVINNTNGSDTLLPSVCLIDTRDPSSFLNLLKGDPERNDILLRMSSFELSSLVPVVRLFKIFRNPSKEEIVLELPFETKATGIDDIFKNGAGRGTGAGITSFQWKQNPKNEAAASTYKVNLNLHLQNVQEFYKSRNSVMLGNTILDVSIQDLLYQRKQWRMETNEGTATYNPDDYIIKVIVGWEISDGGLESLKNNNSRQDVDLFLSAIKNQKEVLYLNFVSHTIEFNDDGSIDLNIDFIGRVDAGINNIEFSNVLTIGRAYEQQVQELRDQINKINSENKELEKQDVQQQAQLGAVSRFFNKLGVNDTDARNKLQENEKVVQDLQTKLDSTIQASKKVKFNYLATKMLQKKQIHLFSYDEKVIELLSKMRGVVNFADPTNVKSIEELRARQQEVKDAQKEEQDNLKAKAKETGVNSTSPVGTASSETLNPKQREELKKTSGSQDVSKTQPTRGAGDQARAAASAAVDEDTQEANDKMYDLILGGDFESKTNVPRGRREFPFFYFSSLIDALIDPIMDTNKKNPNFINKKTRVILGPMTIIDYGSIQDNGQVYRVFESTEAEQQDKPKYVKVYNGKPVTINIGDVPISLREFTRWFNENIVNKNIDRMTLNDFVSSLINDLVLSAITNQVYTYAPKQKARLAIDNFTSICNPSNEIAFSYNLFKYGWGSDVYKGLLPGPGGGFRIAQTALESLRTRGEDAEKDHDPKSAGFLPRKDYMVIYCVNDAPYERVGNYEKDKKDGILHIYPGESRGLVRDLKFSRIDKPHRRADNIIAGTTGGQGVSKIIREKYNVSLEMFGNTIVQAGTYIYIMPYYGGDAGVYETSQILREIGLGGYYTITEVDNVVEVGDFKTSIRGAWSAFGDGTVNDGDKEFGPVPNGVVPEKGVLQ